MQKLSKLIIFLSVLATVCLIFIAVNTGNTSNPSSKATYGTSDRLEFVQEFNQYSASSTASNVSVTTTSTQIVATSTNGYRKYIRLTNDGSTTVYLNFGAAAVNQTGIPLFASTTYEILAGTNPFTTAINGISSSTVKVIVLEKN